MPVNEQLVHNWFFGNHAVRVTGSILFAALLCSVPVGATIRWLFAGFNARLGAAATAGAIVVDLIKGFVATIIPLHGGGLTVGLASALAALLGHYYSPWSHFRGDPTIAVLAGTLLALSPASALVVMAFWLAVALPSRSFEIATRFAAGLVFLPLWYFLGPHAALFGVCAAVLVLLRVGGGAQHAKRFNVQNLD